VTEKKTCKRAQWQVTGGIDHHWQLQQLQETISAMMCRMSGSHATVTLNPAKYVYMIRAIAL
jgi:GTP cyclohydrolase III